MVNTLPVTFENTVNSKNRKATVTTTDVNIGNATNVVCMITDLNGHIVAE